MWTSKRSSVTPALVLLQALYNEYVHFKETEIPAKEIEKGHIEHLYKLLEVRECGDGGGTFGTMCRTH